MVYLTGQFTLDDGHDAHRFDALDTGIVSVCNAFRTASVGLHPNYPQGYDLTGKQAGQIVSAFELLCRHTDALIEFVLHLMAERGDDMDAVRETLYPPHPDADRDEDGHLIDGTLRTAPSGDQLATLRKVAAWAINTAFASVRINTTMMTGGE